MLEIQDVCDTTAEIEKSTAAIEKSNKSLLVTLNEKVGRYTSTNSIYDKVKSENMTLIFFSIFLFF